MERIRFIARHRALPWSLVGLLILAIVIVGVNSSVAQKSSKQPTTVREFLMQYDERDTNLGKIKRIGNDFVLLEEEDAQTIVPIVSIQEVRLVRESAGEPVKIEIRLVSRD